MMADNNTIMAINRTILIALYIPIKYMEVF